MSADRSFSKHLSYRPDIDGVRAIAILSVLGFHAFPAWVPGGFIGVDIFFVISGYLISGIILANLEAGQFSVVDFYKRRIRRIFPALILVLLSVCAAGFVVLWPGEYAYLGENIAGGAGFVVNFLLAQETGYFDGHSETKPLLHLWSLGVEEQFYIVWPLMLWAAWRFKHRAGLLIGVVAVASFGLNLWLSHYQAVTDFYSPLSRFWELLAGGALAWGGHTRKMVLSSRRVTNGLSLFGSLLLLAADFGFNKDLSFPGWWALVPVAGALCLIAAGPGAIINHRLLSRRIVVGIGLISYPLYLWHWPLLSFAQILSGESPDRTVRIAMLVAAVALATLTYLWLEKPLRRQPASLNLALVLGGLMIFIAGVGAAVAYSDGLPQRFANGKVVARALDSTRLITDWQKNVRMNDCHLQDADANSRPGECIEKARPLILLWGDSHAASLYPGLRLLQGENNFGILEFTQSGCPPILDIPHLVFRKNCNEMNERILSEASRLKPDAILLAAGWQHPDYPMTNNEIVERLNRTIAKLKENVPDAKIFVVGPEPRWLSPVPAIYRRALTFSRHLPAQRLDEHLSLDEFELDHLMSEKLTGHVDGYLSPQKVLCNTDGCLTRLGDDLDSLTFIDDEHVSKSASELLIQSFAPYFLPAENHHASPN